MPTYQELGIRINLGIDTEERFWREEQHLKAKILLDRDKELLERLNIKDFQENIRNSPYLSDVSPVSSFAQLLIGRRSYTLDGDIPTMYGYHFNFMRNKHDFSFVSMLVNHERLAIFTAPAFSYYIAFYDYALYRPETPLLTVTGFAAEIPLITPEGTITNSDTQFSRVRSWLQEYQPRLDN